MDCCQIIHAYMTLSLERTYLCIQVSHKNLCYFLFIITLPTLTQPDLVHPNREHDSGTSILLISFLLLLVGDSRTVLPRMHMMVSDPGTNDGPGQPRNRDGPFHPFDHPRVFPPVDYQGPFRPPGDRHPDFSMDRHRHQIGRAHV